jgi:hypothetical protein
MKVLDNYLYIFKKNFNRENKLIRFNLDDLNEVSSELFSFNASYSNIKMYSDYIIYNDNQSDYPLYLFDIKRNTLSHVSSECGYYTTTDHWLKPSDYQDFLNKFNLVGEYLYYEKGKEKELFRINIRTGEKVKMELMVWD